MVWYNTSSGMVNVNFHVFELTHESYIFATVTNEFNENQFIQINNWKSLVTKLAIAKHLRSERSEGQWKFMNLYLYTMYTLGDAIIVHKVLPRIPRPGCTYTFSKAN